MKKSVVKILRVLCVLLRPFTGFVPVLAMLLFLGALFWAKEQDPFSRKWFTLKTATHSSFKCVAVLPKPIRQFPVVIYAHSSGGNLMNDGSDLRQMAELGLAAVSLDYDQVNASNFNLQFESLLRYLGREKWANTNATAWVGFSLGAMRTMGFALQHPEQNPQLLVQLSGEGLPEGQTNSGLGSLRGPIMLIHGDQDNRFPVADTQRLASVLQSNGVPVELKILPGISHGIELDRGVVLRCIGEYSLTHFVGTNAWQNYHSIAQWQAEAPPLWLFWLPAMAWVAGGLAWRRAHKILSPERNILKRHEIALRWLAALLAIWASAETAIHLVPPHFPVADRTLAIASEYLVQPKERADFEFLATQPIWQDRKLENLLDHVELAGYNRELINWSLDDKIYRDFVLSPVITGKPGEQLNWRRPLWEGFYPRIRHESSTADAAAIVVRHLRERITIAALPNMPREVPAIWLRQITDESGFDIIYVAALRSVGVPARLNSTRQAEFWNGKNWQAAPRPLINNWTDPAKE